MKKTPSCAGKMFRSFRVDERQVIRLFPLDDRAESTTSVFFLHLSKMQGDTRTTNFAAHEQIIPSNLHARVLVYYNMY